MSKTRPRVVLVGAGGYGRLYVEALTSQDMGAELTQRVRFRCRGGLRGGVKL